MEAVSTALMVMQIIMANANSAQALIVGLVMQTHSIAAQVVLMDISLTLLLLYVICVRILVRPALRLSSASPVKMVIQALQHPSLDLAFLASLALLNVRHVLIPFINVHLVQINM